MVGVLPCGHILTFILLWWWQWVTADFVGVFSHGSVSVWCPFSLACKTTSSQPPKTLESEKSISFCIRNKSLPINSLLFFAKQPLIWVMLPALQQCRQNLYIVAEVSLFLAFFLHNSSDGKTPRCIPLCPAHLDGDWEELPFWPTRPLCLCQIFAFNNKTVAD